MHQRGASGCLGVDIPITLSKVMDDTSHTIDFVYVLTNKMMPNIVKIGETSWLPEDRAKGLYTTGVPVEFQVAYRAATSHRKAVERRAHELLDKQRVNPNREFFSVTVEEAIEAVRHALIDAAGINCWKGPMPHLLRAGDRVSLTLRSGQIFVLIGYRNFLDEAAEVIDIWQAHSDGDLLEIFATESASQISGFSNDDPGSTEDPIPYLNREKTVANGEINGREWLMPGERIVWVSGPEDMDGGSAIFEAINYCQIASRTWSPKIDPNGVPLLLNYVTHEDMWPAALRSVRTALALPLPRSWAPRENRDSSWVPIASDPAPPEHWLSQLRPARRKRNRK